VGSFERTDQEGYSVARHIFGAEPSDAELHEFILNNYETLKFGKPKDFKLVIKRMNSKRVQREVRKEMKKVKETQRPSTLAQDYMREELEQNKKEKKQNRKDLKDERTEAQYSLKQKKKKEKHLGH